MMDKAELIIDTTSTFFINVLFKNNIKVYHSHFEKDKLLITVNLIDLKKTCEILKIYNKTYELKKTSGLKQSFLNHLKRAGLLVGILFFIVSVSFYSFWVTDIKINGIVISNREEILNVCRRYIDTPILKPNFDLQALKKELVNIESISSVEVEKRGSNIIITVLEELPKVDIADTLTPTPYLAKKNAIITRMVVMQGTPLKKIGDTVREGDTIVAPYFKTIDDIEIKVKAIAEIYGRTQYKRTVFYPNTVLSNVRTGKEKKVTSFSFLGYMSKIKSPFANYEIESSSKNFANVLPFSIFSHTFYEVVAQYVPFDFDAKKEELIERNIDELKSSVNTEHKAIRIWYNMVEEEKGVRLDFFYEVEELI